MNRRSALLTASGLAASFVAGAAAVSFNWGLGTSNAATVAASDAPPTQKVKPIVKHRTIVVHRKAPSSTSGVSAAPQTVVLPAPAVAVAPAPAPVTTTSGSPTAGGERDDSGEGGGD